MKSSLSVRGLLYGVAVSLGLAWIFFRSFYGLFITFIFGIAVFSEQREKEQRQEEMEKRRKSKDLLNSMAASLAAGNSLEQAIIAADKECETLWGEDEAFLRRLRQLEGELLLHIPVENAFASFAKDLKLPEIEQLSGLIAIARKSGGHLRELLKVSASQLEEKMAVEAEIQAKLTEKKTEFMIMTIMPPAILLYVQTFSYDFVAGVYEELWGRVFMAVCVMIYCAAWFMGKRTLDIEV